MAPLAVHTGDSSRSGFPRTRAVRGDWRGSRAQWLIALVLVLILGTLLAVTCRARPAYDAFGWLVWGRQTLHWNLDLNGAPSWKPLTFIFTLPYALTGRSVAMWMWIITSCAGAVAAPLMAGRIAFRLSPRGDGRMPGWLPPLLAGLIACGGTATMTVAAKSTPLNMGLLRQVLIVTSDPLLLALWLGAIDSHISRRYGWALGLLWLTALGRPEAWLFLGGYALWLWLRVPALRLWIALSVLSMPVAWFLAPGLTSRSWLSASNLDMNQPTAIVGNKITGVLTRIRTLSGPAMQIEVGAAIIVALLRRDRGALGLLGLALGWAVVEIAFALHGLSAVQRYMIEAGAPLAIVGGIGVAQVLTLPVSQVGPVRLPLSLAGVVAVLIFLVALVPFAHDSVNGARAVVSNQDLNTAELNALDRLMAKTGGAERVLACGAPKTSLGWQSGLAWQLGLDVGAVGFGPRSAYRTSPVVYFHRVHSTWSIELLNTPPSLESQCAGLDGLSS